MCHFHNISTTLFAKRIERGETIQEALAPPLKEKACVDHLGNKYPSKKALASKYGITSSRLMNRLKSHDLRTSLECGSKKLKSHTIQDHLGNTYHSEREMCKAYGKIITLFAPTKIRD